MASDVTVRRATCADAASCLEIYRSYINTAITFESALPSCEEFAGRIRTISKNYPYLVAEQNGTIIGYAYAHEFKERSAYQWGSELSIYLAPSATHSGIGKALYQCLIVLLKHQGIRTAYGIITTPNDASEALHTSLGFTKSAHLRNAGFKEGAWHDVAWFEKQIAAYSENPDKFVSLSDISESYIAGVLAACNASLAHLSH